MSMRIQSSILIVQANIGKLLFYFACDSLGFVNQFLSASKTLYLAEGNSALRVIDFIIRYATFHGALQKRVVRRLI